MNNYKDIHPKIRDLIRVVINLSRTSEDFIRDLYTVQVVASYGKLKYVAYQRFSKEFLNDTLSPIHVTPIEEQAVKPIWRIDRKRVAHGLTPWFNYE